MVHYLCTSDGQTLHDPSSRGIAKRRIEYRRSVLAYCMEVGYGMPGLKSHPLRHMKTFDDAFDVQRILVIAKEFLTNHSSCLLESEYSDFIRGELEGAMEANGDFLSSLIFCRALETSSCLTGPWWKAWCQCLRRRFHRSATRIGL